MLTVSENGYGKRTVAYEFRITGRGGKGIVAMAVNERNGKLVALLPGRGERPDHAGHRWRPADPLPVDGIRIAGRATQGVIVFDTAEDEHVVVGRTHIPDDEGNGDKAVPSDEAAAD